MQGIVSDLGTYGAKTQYGPKPAFRFKIGGISYSSMGTPEFNDGDTVEFEFTSRGEYNNITKDTLRVIAKGTAQQSSGGGNSSGGKGQFRSVPELNRVDALRYAIEILGDNVSTMGAIQEAVLLEAYITEGIESEIILNTLAEGDVAIPMEDDPIGNE